MRKVIAAILILAFAAASAFSDAKQFDFLLSGMQNASGKPLSGYIVVTRNAANSAPKAVWEDKDKTLPSGAGKSQFNLDSQGRSTVFGDGVYTVILYAGTDTGLTTPLYTFSGVSFDYTASLLPDLANTGAGLGSGLVGYEGQPGYTVTTWVNGHTGATAAHGATGAVVGTTNTQTLTNKTLTTPIIADLSNAQHNHLTVATGGDISRGLRSVQTYFTAGTATWTKPAWLRRALVKVQGGGGGGGKSTAGSGGGGGGAYALELLNSADITNTVTVTVGNFGSGATSANGGAGGQSSFGAYCIANGGFGASGQTGGNGGVASGGTLNITGGAGGSGYTMSPNGSTGYPASANGGGSILGTGGAIATAGGGYGGGGGGGSVTDGTSSNGGAGTQGVVIVEEYE